MPMIVRPPDSTSSDAIDLRGQERVAVGEHDQVGLQPDAVR